MFKLKKKYMNSLLIEGDAGLEKVRNMQRTTKGDVYNIINVIIAYQYSA